MEHFIESSEAFKRAIAIAKTLEADRNSFPDTFFALKYSVKKEMVFSFYCVVCECILVEHQPTSPQSIKVQQYDVDFMKNMLGDFLDDSYFEPQFIENFIKEQLAKHGRVLWKTLHFFFLAGLSDNGERGLGAELFDCVYAAIFRSYPVGQLQEHIISVGEDSFDVDSFDNDAFIRPYNERFSTLPHTLETTDMNQYLDDYFKTVHPEVQDFFKQNTKRIPLTKATLPKSENLSDEMGPQWETLRRIQKDVEESRRIVDETIAKYNAETPKKAGCLAVLCIPIITAITILLIIINL